MTSPFKSPWIYLPESDEYTLFKQGKRRVGLDVNRISPFISAERILSAQACTQTSQQKISANIGYGIVHLHHSTMELCAMKFGSAILISATSVNKQRQIASFTVLPSISVPPGKISMSSDDMSALGIENDEFIHAFGAMDHVQTVETIRLHSEEVDILPGSCMMEEYISHKLQNRYVVQNQPVTIESYGKKCTYRPHCDIGQSDTTNEAFGNHVMKYNCQKLNNISLNDNPGDNRLSPNKISIQDFISVPVYRIVKETNVHLSKNHLPSVDLVDHIVSYNNLGGLENQIKKIKNHVEVPLNHPNIFEKSGITPSTGVILHGPPGTGKTMLLKSCSNSVNCRTVTIDVAKLCSKDEDNMEEELLMYFNSAMRSAPTLVLIDNIDIICSKRDAARRDIPTRLDIVLSNLLDRISAHNRASHNFVILLTATNTLESITPMLRQTKRLEYEIEISIPSSSGRHEIFQKELDSYSHGLDKAEIRTLAEKAHGYVGSDIAAICKEAGRIAFERSLSSTLSELSFQLSDFEIALKRVPPSAIRELVIEVPKVFWSDIGGNSKVKKMLEQTIEWPLKHPEKLEKLKIKAPTGVLLYGPPGCSKTLTAKALATESGLNFISIKGPELFRKYVGDSEAAIRRIFAKARAASPSIIFIDELDALAGERSGNSNSTNDMTTRVVATLLTELDGIQARQDVIIVGATNRPDKIDKALLRPGRIDRMVHVPLPDDETRKDILNIQFRDTPVSIDMDWLVEKTNQYSGAEICAVCHEAGLAALDRDMDASMLIFADFEVALSLVHPQTTKNVIELYENFARTSSATKSIS